MPMSRSPIGIQPPSPDQRTWMIFESSGSIRRKAATVSGAASSSKRAVNSNPPAVIPSMVATLAACVGSHDRRTFLNVELVCVTAVEDEAEAEVLLDLL